MSILIRKEEETVLKRETPISVESLKLAITKKCDNCYGAMSFANRLGGTLTDDWYLCYGYPLKDLLDEAVRQGVDLSTLKTSISGVPIQESLYYKRATGEMTEQEFQSAFKKWQKGE